ncbi:FecR family protein [Brevundimonas sp. SL130]|uniref:FecR family protein n=1 Tax=Brevundimonas sp. SL130 TaxID=2995143 RepID=UPI00226CA05A|nr:FecR domain-containing protein [Brevundimonas sp. SL130]WAC59762.1 FecR domain-containing protein [Brevundimonas sp. SL130]
MRDDEAEAFVAARLAEERGEVVDPRAASEIDDVWDAIGQLDASDFAVDEVKTRLAVNRRAWLVGGTLAAGVAFGGVFLWRAQPVVHETGIGERRTVTLPDGSQVTLNTASRIEVRFGGGRREVVLAAGEAFFSVQRQADHAPFDVFSHAAQIRVTGTRFNLYQHPDFTDVDLLEGGVTVGPANGQMNGQMNDQTRDQANAAVRLAPGQAVRVSASGRPGSITSARVGRIDDWRRGLVSFDRTPLSAAVAEMNRYSRAPLRLDDAALGQLRIDGVFETGDTAAFAKALHGLYDVAVRQDGEAWRLSSSSGATNARR